MHWIKAGWALALFVGTIVWLSEQICKFLERWLRESEAANLRGRFERLWIQMTDSPPRSAILTPLRLLSAFYDRAFGVKLLSGRVVLRACFFSNLILVASLLVTGLIINQPLAIRPAPWEFYRDSLTTVGAMQRSLEGENMKTNVMAIKMKRDFDQLAALNGPASTVVYSVFFFLLVIGLNSVIGAASFALTRGILREMLLASGSLTLVSALLFNLILIVLFSVFVLLVLSVAALPVCWPLLPGLAEISSQSLVLSLILLVLGGLGAVWLSATWLKVAALVAVLPWAASTITLGASALMHPFRRRIHAISAGLLLRVAEAKHGPVSLVATALAIVVILLSYVVSRL